MNKLRRINNKRGDLTGILYLIVSISAFAFFLLIASYISTNISTELKERIGSDDIRINDSFDSTANTAQNTFSALWYIMFAGLLLGLLITAWNMPTHPIYVPIFIILLVAAVIVGVALSNVYEELYAVDEFSDAADTQTSISFIMSNLPYIALVVGLIALVVTFAKPGGRAETVPIM